MVMELVRKLPYDHPYRWDGTAFGGPKLWQPNEITTALWLDAADADTITLNGSNVSQWDDKSGNDKHATQTGSTSQPESGADTINGLNTLKFDGSNDRLLISSPLSSPINNAYMFIVYKVNSTSTSGTCFQFGSVRWLAHAPWSDGNIYFDLEGPSNRERISAASGFSVGDDVLMGFYGSVTDDAQEIWKNGSLLASATGGNYSVTAASTAEIGGVSGSQYQSASIGEIVLVESTVDETTRQKIEGYLAWKWGLEANLPALHPYEDAPPTV